MTLTFIHSLAHSLAHVYWHSCVPKHKPRKWYGKQCQAVDAKAFINPLTISTSDTYSKYDTCVLVHVFLFFPSLSIYILFFLHLVMGKRRNVYMKRISILFFFIYACNNNSWSQIFARNIRIWAERKKGK